MVLQERKIFYLWFMTFISFQTNIFSSNMSHIIIEQIQNEIIKDYDVKMEEKEIVSWKKASLNLVQDKKDQRQVLKVKDVQEMSGKEKIAFLLKKNRDNIKTQKKDQNLKDKIQKNEKLNDNLSKTHWMDSKVQSQKSWSSLRQQETDSWVKEKQKLLLKWEKEKKNYVKKIKVYKKTLAIIPISKEKIKEFQPSLKPSLIKNVKKIKLPIFESTSLIEKGFSPLVKDQGKRPTCSAFAGIRAIEILAQRKNKMDALSEQFFYWSSKPRCQDKQCLKRGSWVVNGFNNSLSSSGLNIPSRQDCPYSKVDNKNNQTQTPLPSQCFRGYLKVNRFSQVRGISGIVSALESNYPVIGAFRLSKSFYRNNGYIFLHNKKTPEIKLDKHAQGHAILIVGMMSLPKQFHLTEGRNCFLVSNSWGEGWGKGGHACISEAWLNKYHYNKTSYIVLEEVI